MESSATNSYQINTNDAMREIVPGMRFRPTDDEVIAFYLKRKVRSIPLPANIVPEINVNLFDPWHLTGESEEERYFFSTNEAKYSTGNRASRTTNSGRWKITGKERRIVATYEGYEIVGYKKILVFYTGNHTDITKTPWIMHEYRLADVNANWVMCKIFKRREEALTSSSSHSNEDAVME